jgi:hypothetical protein
MGDRLLNKVIERAQLWAEVKDDDSVNDGKVVMRKRKSFLDARKEAFDYVKGLERTVVEVENRNEALDRKIDGLHGELADCMGNLRAAQHDKERLSKEIEDRNRRMEQGPDQIAAEYIARLGIPELTTVFNRTVLGR